MNSAGIIHDKDWGFTKTSKLYLKKTQSNETLKQMQSANISRYTNLFKAVMEVA